MLVEKMWMLVLGLVVKTTTMTMVVMAALPSLPDFHLMVQTLKIMVVVLVLDRSLVVSIRLLRFHRHWKI
jgi:hypothetical protein